jgi:sugar-specific transcriptional regulator TrmB
MMIMIKKLRSLGFTKNLATVYFSLLELGSTTAGEICKKTRLHRNIVYENLERLLDKGLASFVIVRNVKHFHLSDPEKLINDLENERRELKKKEQVAAEVVVEIKKKRKATPQHEATIYKGKKGVKNILNEIARTATFIDVLGTGWGMRETVGIYYERWHKELARKEVPSRIILPKSRKEQFLKPFKAKYLPEKHLIPSTICIYNENVVTIMWGDDPVAILIRSSSAAESYKNYFTVLWEIATEDL